MIDVTMPDGTVIQGVPDGVTKAQLQAKYAQHVGASQPESAVGGFMNGVAAGGTFNLMAPIAAALGATTGEGRSHAPDWVQRYKDNLASYRAQDEATASTHPAANITGNITGGFLNPVTRALPLAKTLGGAIAQGAGVGAGYGAGTAVTNQDDLGGAAKDIGTAAAIGGAIPAVIPAVGWAAKKAGQGIAHGLGLTTGVGAKPIEQAFQAGAAGGDQAQAFASNMRGDTPWSDVVDQARGALANMRADRNAAYRSGMVDISKDPTVLSFEPIEKAVQEASAVKSFKGQDLSKSTADVRQQISEAVNTWKGLNPAEYHTPEGFDALKQQIGDIKDNLPFGSPQRVVADKVYNSIRKTIAEQAPTYGKVMSQYGEASDAIDAIQKELSLGPKGNPGTAMRKLQSVMRNNVNTSYGNRASYADALSKAGADTLMPALAGQSMSSVLPRGLGRVVGGAELAAAALNPGFALKTGALLAASSPRLVGEGAFGLGRGVNALQSLPRISGLTGLGVGQALTAPGAAAISPALLPRLK